MPTKKLVVKSKVLDGTDATPKQTDTEPAAPLAVPKKRLAHSNFFLTINTNQVFRGGEEGYKPFVDRFKEALGDIFGPDHLGDFINITVPGHSFDSDYIKDVDVEFVVERGGKLNTIHAHGLIKISHWSLISLNYHKVREEMIKRMELPGLYMNVKLFRNSNDKLQDYLYKDVDEQESMEPISIN